MQAHHFKYLLLCLTLASLACTKIIDIEVPESPPQLVVNGRVDNSTGAVVQLTASRPFFSEEQPAAVAGARVSLYDSNAADSSVAIELLENDAALPEFYIRRRLGSIGHFYRLEVDLANSSAIPGEPLYQSEWEEMRRSFSFDSISIEFLDLTTTPAVFEEGFYALGYFTEPPGEGDFYRIITNVNGSSLSDEIFILSDEFADGRNIGVEFPPLTLRGPLDPNDSLRVEVLGITEDYYRYLELLNSQRQVGSLFDPPPAPLFGNLARLPGEEEFALGYFYASALTVQTVIFR